MKYGEMIEYIRSHPLVAISHVLFSDNEYIFQNTDGNVYDENGYLFENWDFCSNQWNGLRCRDFGPWQSGWFVKAEVLLTHLQK